MKEKKILFIASGPSPPGTTKDDNPFYYISEYCSGHVLGSTWPTENHKEYTKNIQSSFGKFEYHTFKYSQLPSLLKSISRLLNYLTIGSKILIKNDIDIIISYGFFITGISSTILSVLYNKPLLVQVPGVPYKALKYSGNNNLLAKFILDFSIFITTRRCKAVWLLFKGQLDEKQLKNKKIYIFHDFAPISLYHPNDVTEAIISFIGYPWDLKGVDILIEAFKILNKEFPETELRIAGHCENRAPYIEQIKGLETKIKLLDSLNRSECVDFITSTKIFVLPSRTEAMGRVLLEAMASEKIIVASNVDGIPHYIEHNHNGLLFESGNIQDLYLKLKTVVADQVFGQKLAQNARSKVLELYNENKYAKNINLMVNEVIKK